MRDPYDAVLLIGFGGPEGQDDVIPFLHRVTRGRDIPDSRLEIVAAHYRAFDGVSPVNAQNRALVGALEAELSRRGLDLPVYWGNRNWMPLLSDVVAEAASNGHTRLLAITTSAYSSYSSCRQYREDITEALETTGLTGTVEIDVVRPYFDHPGFVTPFIAGVKAALAGLAAKGIPVAATHVLFTTHSIPLADAARSGPAGGEFGPLGAYVAQHRAVASVVMAALSPDGRGTDLPRSGGSQGVPDSSLVFQSRSGPQQMPWLEPDINESIVTLAVAGTRAVVVVPIGFTSDHMEVVWDLDTEAVATAAGLGITLVRVPTPGIQPAFVAGLVDLVVERLTPEPGKSVEPGKSAGSTESRRNRAALTAFGPWADVCPLGCCQKGTARRGARPERTLSVPGAV